MEHMHAFSAEILPSEASIREESQWLLSWRSIAELTNPTVWKTEGGYFKVTVSTCLFLVKSYSLYPITCSLTSSWTIPINKLVPLYALEDRKVDNNTFYHQVHHVLEQNKDLITGMKEYLSAHSLIRWFKMLGWRQWAPSPNVHEFLESLEWSSSPVFVLWSSHSPLSRSNLVVSERGQYYKIPVSI